MIIGLEPTMNPRGTPLGTPKMMEIEPRSKLQILTLLSLSDETLNAFEANGSKIGNIHRLQILYTAVGTVKITVRKARGAKRGRR